MLFTDNLKYDLTGIIIATLVIIVAYFKWSLGYWKRRGIETPPTSIPFGNTADLFLKRKFLGEIWRDIYFNIKSKGKRHGGAYFTIKPFYVPVDLDLVKNILQNDFQNFHGHGLYVNEEIDPLSGDLFSLDGPRWRTMRVKLTPTFTSGKMKMMTQTLIECSYGLAEIFDSASNKNEPIETKDVMGRFTTDIIGSCAFGIDCNCIKNPDSEFRKYGLLAVDPGFLESLRQFAVFVVPHNILSYINYKATPPQISNFFMGIVKETVAYRERNNVKRKDFMDLLIQLKDKGKLHNDDGEDEKNEKDVSTERMTINEIAAQCFLFFLAGFETSSTTMNFATYELATNLDVQDKLRTEINTVLKKHDDKLTYNAIMEMGYLDKVLCETLRKYPPLPVLFRVCNKEYNVPGTDLVIQKGKGVMIPIWGIHYDPEYYPNPEKFEPERFNEENKASRPAFSWLPFGEGPRICIGLRFGMLQSKIGLVTLLRNYRITLNKKTQVPIVYKKTGLITSPEGGIWLDIHKVNN